MKEMTSAEFARANLAELDEPVRIRRYTKTVGTYYPDGFEPIVEQPGLLSVDAARVAEGLPPKELTKQIAQERIIELEGEVARLKRELAKRLPIEGLAGPTKGHDPFSGLAKQDRDFFERKLGGKKK